MTEDDRPHGPYNLPGPDMNVFGSDQAEGNGASERADEPTVPGTPGESGTPHGTMRFQDAETTTPRPPTLAEQRARRSAEAERAAERAAADRTAQTRRRVMIGSGVTIGVVG